MLLYIVYGILFVDTVDMWLLHNTLYTLYCTKDQSNVEDVEDRSNTP